VWAVETRRAPTFWFPRDCPRGCVWPVSTTREDLERFFGQSAASRVHVVEAGWLRRIRDCRLLDAYRRRMGWTIPWYSSTAHARALKKPRRDCRRLS
jgi:hypothetical protein